MCVSVICPWTRGWFLLLLPWMWGRGFSVELCFQLSRVDAQECDESLF